ncbi:unnamed protein product [Mytilus edulis]|uniref:Reverse transcriptase domain-containing protein n=1 Tax=Mytilus edulis TaxID=6550 RepID=A0A8S3V5X8_MYTED|nr:unnamed protein product [Mytilus edulis]
MASRRKRKSTSRFSPDSIESSRQENDCSSWTVKKFKEELTNIGINITSKLSKTVLQQIYFDNLKSVSEPEQLSNEDQEVSPTLPNVTSNSSNELPLLIGNLTEVVIGLRDSMNSNTNRNNSNTSLSADFSGNIQDSRRNRFQQVHTADEHVFSLYKWYGVSPSESDCGINPTLNTSTATINGVPSSSVPFLDIISPALKKQIIEGRDVNLAGLLMKDYESVQAASTLLTSSGLEINLPGKKDIRLHRTLTIKEFVCAFGKYKRVIGINEGFDTMIKCTDLPTLECKNNFSARSQPLSVRELINKECEKGFLSGPYKIPPFNYYRVSPLGLAVGKYSGKKRLILDLSAPHDDDDNCSINDLISKEDCSMTYVRIDDAIKVIRKLGRFSLCSKFDIEAAFKQLDDFLTIDKPDSCAERTMALMTTLFKRLNIPLAKHKVVGPCTVIEYLGIILDTEKMETRLPLDKTSRISEFIKKFLNRQSCTKRELLQLTKVPHKCRQSLRVMALKSTVSDLWRHMLSTRTSQTYKVGYRAIPAFSANNGVVCVTDVEILDSYAILHLKTSKTDPFRKGVSIQLHKSDHTICPFSAVQKYIAIRKGREASFCFSDPLFVKENGNALDRDFSSEV